MKKLRKYNLFIQAININVNNSAGTIINEIVAQLHKQKSIIEALSYNSNICILLNKYLASRQNVDDK